MIRFGCRRRWSSIAKLTRYAATIAREGCAAAAQSTSRTPWDDKSCIANAECIGNLWWVWMVSVLGFAVYSLYIVLSSGDFGDNALSCLLFYFQISSFAAIADDSSDVFQWILEVSQVGSLVALASGACYAPNMSAYNATASKLIGPLFVFAFSAVWTAIARALQPQLQARSIRLHVSYSGTFAATFLFVFSSVCKIVFTLVKCTRYDSDGFVFIDGTVDCLDDKWKALVVVVALLCLFPVLFFAALRLNKLPPDARAVICRSFTESEFYWPASDPRLPPARVCHAFHGSFVSKLAGVFANDFIDYHTFFLGEYAAPSLDTHVLGGCGVLRLLDCTIRAAGVVLRS